MSGIQFKIFSLFSISISQNVVLFIFGVRISRFLLCDMSFNPKHELVCSCLRTARSLRPATSHLARLITPSRPFRCALSRSNLYQTTNNKLTRRGSGRKRPRSTHHTLGQWAFWRSLKAIGSGASSHVDSGHGAVIQTLLASSPSGCVLSTLAVNDCLTVTAGTDHASIHSNPRLVQVL